MIHKFLRRERVWLATIVIGTVFIHLLAVNLLPSAITYSKLRGLYSGNSLGRVFVDNKLYAGTIKIAPNDIVPLDNPDNLSSFAIYNVRNGPVRLHAVVPEAPYWSVAITAYNTDHVYVLNDLQVDGKSATLVIKDKDHAYTAQGMEQVVTVPSGKGMVLIRAILSSRDQGKVPNDFIRAQQASYIEEIAL